MLACININLAESDSGRSVTMRLPFAAKAHEYKSVIELWEAKRWGEAGYEDHIRVLKVELKLKLHNTFFFQWFNLDPPIRFRLKWRLLEFIFSPCINLMCFIQIEAVVNLSFIQFQVVNLFSIDTKYIYWQASCQGQNKSLKNISLAALSSQFNHSKITWKENKKTVDTFVNTFLSSPFPADFLYAQGIKPINVTHFWCTD